MSKNNEIITYSARVPVNVDKEVKQFAKNTGASKNAILLLALKDYIAKEVNT
ncbi:MAG: hypothetical protein H6Q69_1817 [Firmicutes bacterium]|nr:hypothetical protein [Bacillota bacterium]